MKIKNKKILITIIKQINENNLLEGYINEIVGIAKKTFKIGGDYAHKFSRLSFPKFADEDECIIKKGDKIIVHVQDQLMQFYDMDMKYLGSRWQGKGFGGNLRDLVNYSKSKFI